MKPTDPPALPTKLLELLVPQQTSEPLLGDLIEQYESGRSRRWYWRQVILALVISAGREARTRKLQAIRAVIVGYLYWRVALLFHYVGRRQIRRT